MDFFKEKVCNLLLLKAQNCQSLDLETLAFLFSEENHLRLDMFSRQLLLQLLHCRTTELLKRHNILKT